MPDPPQHQRVSPSPSPVRGLRLFRAIGRRLARLEKREKSSSSDDNSCGSPKNGQEKSDDRVSEVTVEKVESDGERVRHKSSDKQKQVSLNVDSSDSASERTSGSSSDTSAILTKVFKKLTIGGASGSKKRKQPQKSILRRPTCHIYVRGISGLPTQRVPVSRGYYRNPHRSSIQYTGAYPRSSNSAF